MKKYKINVLDESHIFSQRENGTTHTPYKFEKDFLDSVKKGSRTDIKAYIEQMTHNGITVGRMSDNDLRQMQYWAVSSMTLLTRCAIQSGLDETTSFNFSDNCIYRIDKMTDSDEIVEFLISKCIELTNMIAENRENSVYPKPIRKCLHYINTHLHEKLSTDILALECGLSADYLSFLFKKNMGINLSRYIRLQRLEASKEMLRENYSVSDAAYYLGFCSESYYIKCFKKEFGKTPKAYNNAK